MISLFETCPKYRKDLHKPALQQGRDRHIHKILGTYDILKPKDYVIWIYLNNTIGVEQGLNRSS